MSHEETLEIFQGICSDNLCTQTIPVSNGAWQEGELEAIYIRLWPNVLTLISSNWLRDSPQGVVCFGNFNQLVGYFVQEAEPVCLPSLCEGFPAKISDDCGDGCLLLSASVRSI